MFCEEFWYIKAALALSFLSYSEKKKPSLGDFPSCRPALEHLKMHLSAIFDMRCIFSRLESCHTEKIFEILTFRPQLYGNSSGNFRF